VIIIDQKNYHIFQPLLYQVAAAALSPAEIVVLFQWASSYLTYQKDARLIVNNDWRFYKK
jgi:NADH dehydrogenase FAD-containing subunit